MEREDFIKQMSLGLALVCAGSCMTSCTKKNDPQPAPAPVLPASVTLDASLVPNVGDYYPDPNHQVLLIRIAAGNSASSFVATEKVCPHQSGELIWIKSLNLIQCQQHQSEYRSDGSIIQGPQFTTGTTRALVLYNLSISGTTITITQK